MPRRRLAPTADGAQRAGAALALGVAAVLWLRFGSANVDRVLSSDLGVHVDFETFWRSAAALWEGGSLYHNGAHLPNLNPPLWTVLVAPFGLLDPLPAYRLFALLTVALVVGGALAVAVHLRLHAGWTALVAAALLASSPLLGTVALGQAYGVLAAGLVGCWLADRRGRLVLAGALLGLVVAVKPTLAPLLLLPVAQRRWPVLAAAVAAVAGGFVLGLVVAGPAATVEWLGLVRAEPLSTFVDNASMLAAVARLGGPVWLGFALGATALAITAHRVWRRRLHDDFALWTLVAATLLVSPVAWHNYLVLCAPAVPLLIGHGRHASALLLAAMPLIGVEWAWLWPDDGGWPSRLALSLYGLILLTYWLVLASQATSRRLAPVDRGVEAM